MQSFPTQGFACKSGVILEFWGHLHAVIKRLSLAWCETLTLLNKALKRFLKFNQRYDKA
ncbi:hypothetical protein [Helicobacter pylori]|uniref:hypothetical protein n=1 Tax=Helicobacter pylori TaxID=210 RepID=UPI001E5BFF16|nr:hypothetical protein [Helicobacter pylori]